MAAKLDLTNVSVVSSFNQLLHIGDDSLIEADATAHYITNGTGTQSNLSISTTRVGIGTEAPATRLTVRTPVNEPMEVVMEGSDGDYTGIMFGSNETTPGYRNAGIFVERMDGNDLLKLHFALDANVDGSNVDLTDSKMAIDYNGNVGIGATSPSHRLVVIDERESGTASAMHVQNILDGYWTAIIESLAASPYVMKLLMDADIDADTHAFLRCDNDGDQTKFVMYASGNCQNVNGIYGGSLSDERLKTDVKDANSQWDDLKNLRFVNWKRSVDVDRNGDDKKRIGVIAQEAIKVSPMLVGKRSPHIQEIKYDSNFGTLYTSEDEEVKTGEGKEGEIKEIHDDVLFFKDSLLFWKCAKALQEAMERIEELESKVEALENV